MKTLTNQIFLIALAVFAIYHFVPVQPYLPVFQYYLDDLLCLPLILTLILFVHRTFRISSESFILPRSHILISLTLLAGVFEIFLPRITLGFTADLYDVIAYGSGAAIFDLFINV